MFQPLKATYENCGVMKIPELRYYEFDKIGRLKVNDFLKDEPWKHKLQPLPKIHKVGTFNPRKDVIGC